MTGVLQCDNLSVRYAGNVALSGVSINVQAGKMVGLVGANGAGSNTILVSPDHDLVVVWRWHAGNIAEVGTRVVAAIKPGTM